jgi:hypothetical protein
MCIKSLLVIDMAKLGGGGGRPSGRFVGTKALRIDSLRARTSSSAVSVAGSRVSTTRGHWRSSIFRASPLRLERWLSLSCALARCLISST